ncbi:MAG: beta-ketoacyl synthase N-terminal-like domain-containing protein, partial [Rhodoferax sp.]
MQPLLLSQFTATSCIGRGLTPTLASLRARRSGLQPCDFDGAGLDTWTGSVAGVDDEVLHADLRVYDCRNNRLAQLGLKQDHFEQAVEQALARVGRRRMGVFLGTSTSGIGQTELAYRHRDLATGALPADFHYASTHNPYSVSDFVRRYFQIEGPALAVSSACSSSAKVFGSARRMLQAGLI